MNLKIRSILLVGTLLVLPSFSGHAQSVNKTTAPCQDKISTVEMANCFGTAYKKADGDLNRSYASILKVLQGRDLDNLRSAQRLWIQFRDADCKAQLDLTDGGSIGPISKLTCMEQLTRQRNADLHTIYGERIGR